MQLSACNCRRAIVGVQIVKRANCEARNCRALNCRALNCRALNCRHGNVGAQLSGAQMSVNLCNTSHAKSKSKHDNSKPKSPLPLSVYYNNVRGLRGNFTDLEALYSRITLTSSLSVKPTCMKTSSTLISNCLATCQSIVQMLGICTTLVFMLRAILQLIETLFLKDYSCFHKALILQPSANIMVW